MGQERIWSGAVTTSIGSGDAVMQMEKTSFFIMESESVNVFFICLMHHIVV